LTLELEIKAKRFVESEEPLSQQVVFGSFWVFVLRIIQQGLGLVKIVILARLLAPADFGLMGVALVTMTTLETFSQTGFQAALIQKREDIRPYLNTVWTVSILRGLFLFVILFFIAPYAATFFDIPMATPIIRTIGLVILLQSFTNIGVIYFQKNLEFSKQFVYQFSGVLADFVVAVLAALILKNVWALVFGLIAGGLVRSIVSYVIHPARPHFSLESKKARELLGYGKWIWGTSILKFLFLNVDNMFIGKLCGVTMLGFYQMAYRISNMPSTDISLVISQVTLPAYSKLQSDIPRLREAYLKVLQFTTFLSFLMAGLIFALAPEFTSIFLGEKWLPMVPAMQVLVLAGLMRVIGSTSDPIFQAVGKPEITTKLQPAQLLVFFTLVYPFTIRWGILGTSFAVLLSRLVWSIGFGVMVVKVTKCEVRDFIKRIILPLINTLVMASSILFLKHSINVANAFEFSLLVGWSILIYLVTTYISDRQTLLSIKEAILLITWKRSKEVGDNDWSKIKDFIRKYPLLFHPAKLLYRFLSFLRALPLYMLFDPFSIENKWYTAIKKTQINRGKPLFLDRQNEIKEFFNVNNFYLLKYYLRHGFPNTNKFKERTIHAFEGNTEPGKLKKAYDSISFHYTLRLMLAYERYSMVTDYLDFMKKDSCKNFSEFRVLDYGCGVSDIGLLFASLGAEVTICDLDNKKFDFTEWRFKRRGYSPHSIRVADTEVYPELPESRFDLIIATELFEHVRDPLRLLKNLTNALKTGGYLLDSMGGNSERDDRPHHLQEAFKIGNSEGYKEYYSKHYIHGIPKNGSRYLFKRREVL
jgi:O-antigen/teichoic acid export membrane protein/SAM-dependent methyltransferase